MVADAPMGKRSPPLLADPMLRRNRELDIDVDGAVLLVSWSARRLVPARSKLVINARSHIKPG